MAPSVGSPPSISRAGAGAWVTPSSHWRQASFGRTVTIARSGDGTRSCLSVRSSPIFTISPQPHCVLSGEGSSGGPAQTHPQAPRTPAGARPQTVSPTACRKPRAEARAPDVPDGGCAFGLHLGLAHQRLILGAKRLQRRKRLPRRRIRRRVLLSLDASLHTGRPNQPHRRLAQAPNLTTPTMPAAAGFHRHRAGLRNPSTLPRLGFFRNPTDPAGRAP